MRTAKHSCRQTHRVTKPVTLAILIVVFASESAMAQTPTEILTQMKTACEEIRTASFEGTHEYFGALNGRLSSFAKIEMKRNENSADGLEFLVLADSVSYDHDTQTDYRLTTLFDGTNLLSFDPQKDIVHRGNPDNAMDRMVLLNPIRINSINALLRPDAIDRMLDAETRSLYDSVVDGEFCHVLSIKLPIEGTSDFQEIIMHIAKSDLLPRRIESWLDRDGRPGVDVCTIRKLRINQTIDDDHFVLKNIDGVSTEDVSLRVGLPAPKWTISDVEQKQVSLRDQRGAVVVMEFWATWCAPCRQSLKTLEEMRDKYADQDVRMFAINVMDDATSEQMSDLFETLNLKLTPYAGGEGLAEQYHVKGLPTAIVIDQQGNIAWHGVGHSTETARQMSDVIEALLAE